MIHNLTCILQNIHDVLPVRIFFVSGHLEIVRIFIEILTSALGFPVMALLNNCNLRPPWDAGWDYATTANIALITSC